jgi:porin
MGRAAYRVAFWLAAACAAGTLAAAPALPHAEAPVAEAVLDAELLEVSAVRSPRQAGSANFEQEMKRADVPAYEFGAVYKASVWTGLSGPLRGRAAYLGNLDLKLTVAGEKAWSLPGNTLFVHLLHNHGSKPNRRVAAAQGIDNIEVEINTGKLYQLWMQQQFADDRVSLLAGLYDLNSEFYVTESSGIFLHPALGIGTDMAQTGQNGPSIFPTTSLALRVRVEPFDRAYLQAAVLDGVPGDPDDPRGTHVHLRDGDGALWIAEAGLSTGSETAPGKLALGGWRYSARFDHLTDVDAAGDPLRGTSRGGYLLAEQSLWRAGEGRPGAITGFLRYGFASSGVNEFGHALAAGAVWLGALAGRDEDTLALVYAGARRGDPFRRAALAAGEPVARHEHAWELAYKARIADWLWLQPGFQHVVTRATDAPRSTLAYLRAEVEF